MLYRFIFGCFDLLVKIVFSGTKNLSVVGGPFKGMSYVQGAVGSSLTPKILGTYELEIARWISELPRFQVGLDVGAAEGYYAVGLLKREICERVIAWDMDPQGQALMHKLSAVNGMRDRLEIRGHCDPDQLRKSISCAEGNVLVVIDCEGFEGELLGPLEGILLSRCTFVIETHNPMNPGVHEKLLQQFENTHDIQQTYPKRRLVTDFPANVPGLLKIFGIPVIRRIAMSERRCPDLGWLLCSPKAN